MAKSAGAHIAQAARASARSTWSDGRPPSGGIALPGLEVHAPEQRSHLARRVGERLAGLLLARERAVEPDLEQPRELRVDGRDGPRQCADFYTEEKATIVPRSDFDIVKMGMD